MTLFNILSSIGKNTGACLKTIVHFATQYRALPTLELAGTHRSSPAGGVVHTPDYNLVREPPPGPATFLATAM